MSLAVDLRFGRTFVTQGVQIWLRARGWTFVVSSSFEAPLAQREGGDLFDLTEAVLLTVTEEAKAGT